MSFRPEWAAYVVVPDHRPPSGCDHKLVETDGGPELATRPTSAEIVAALREAGWLLEQDTAKTLERNGFHVTRGKAFPDPDDSTVSREIDVHAYSQVYRSEELTFSIGARILAECK